MAEPKKRHTNTRSGNRKSHLAVKSNTLSICSHCKQKMQPHVVCPNCGYYNGVDVLKLEEKARLKEERRKAQESEEEAK